MSFFSNALNEVLKTNTSSELATNAGLSQSLISHYQREQRIPSRDSLRALVNSLHSTADQWMLIKAYLLDNCPDEYLNHVRPLLDAGDTPKEVMEPSAEYNSYRELISALDTLKGKAMTNQLLKSWLIALARRW